jgi:hypothetical protein
LRSTTCRRPRRNTNVFSDRCFPNFELERSKLPACFPNESAEQSAQRHSTCGRPFFSRPPGTFSADGTFGGRGQSKRNARVQRFPNMEEEDYMLLGIAIVSTLALLASYGL